MVERQSAKAMVMRAMLTCAGEVGFRNVTAAGVRRRFAGSRLRFYCVFRGRRACFEAAHRAESRRLWDRLARAAACRQAHRPLEAALAELGDFARSEPALARGLLVEPRVAGGAAATRHEELLGRYATALDAALRAPERLPSPPAVSAAFMVATVESALAAALGRGRPQEFADAVPELAATIESAFGRPALSGAMATAA